jgi:hypothetical protein
MDIGKLPETGELQLGPVTLPAGRRPGPTTGAPSAARWKDD